MLKQVESMAFNLESILHVYFLYSPTQYGSQYYKNIVFITFLIQLKLEKHDALSLRPVSPFPLDAVETTVGLHL